MVFPSTDSFHRLCVQYLLSSSSSLLQSSTVVFSTTDWLASRYNSLAVSEWPCDHSLYVATWGPVLISCCPDVQSTYLLRRSINARLHCSNLYFHCAAGRALLSIVLRHPGGVYTSQTDQFHKLEYGKPFWTYSRRLRRVARIFAAAIHS